MYNSQLKDYVCKYSGFFDESFCKDIVDSIKNAQWKMHEFYNAIDKTNYSYEHELSVSYENFPLKEKLDKKIWNAINQYITQDMAYMGDWFCGWSNYSLSRFNRYDPTTQMKLHCDHIHTLFDGERKGVPILTVLGALNNDYEGGEFILCGEQIEFKAGEVLVFPSNFLYPHEVKPVKSGTRYSFVSWTW